MWCSRRFGVFPALNILLRHFSCKTFGTICIVCSWHFLMRVKPKNLWNERVVKNNHKKTLNICLKLNYLKKNIVDVFSGTTYIIYIPHVAARKLSLKL